MFNLPDDIFQDKTILNDPIIIHHHVASENNFKERALLHRDAVSLVITGHKTMHFIEKTIHTSEKEIHFLSAGNCIVSADISVREGFESILIFFDANELAEFYSSNSNFVDTIRKKYNPKATPYIAFEKDGFIHNYIQSIHILLSKKEPLPIEMKRLKFRELLLYLLYHRTETFLSFQSSQKISREELKIRKVTESNILTNLSLDEMAFLCSLSKSTFTRQFRKIYNTSPSAWILGQKMKLAKQMLTEQKEKPGEIWFKLGFESHSGFTKSFKKHFSIAPKEVSVPHLRDEL
jgi:AraC-like DNA-binding protein